LPEVFHGVISYYLIDKLTEDRLAGMIGSHLLAVLLQAAAGVGLSLLIIAAGRVARMDLARAGSAGDREETADAERVEAAGSQHLDGDLVHPCQREDDAQDEREQSAPGADPQEALREATSTTTGQSR
jgi:hypothetical protein